MTKTLFGIILLLFASPSLWSANLASNDAYPQLSETANISILTSYPSEEAIFTVFGHSCIRVLDSKSNIDLVFNYGIFDFNSPNFIYRFTTGETDYMVVSYLFNNFLHQNLHRQIKTQEQIINLNQREKQKIFEYLLNNSRPENRVYRYNIFHNNCATKLIDILEDNIEGKLEYPKFNDADKKSFRELVHEHVISQPWLMFGIDLILGQDADLKTTERETMFLPLYEYNILNQSSIIKTDTTYAAVKTDFSLIPAPYDTPQSKGIFTIPFLVSTFVLLVTCISLYFVYKKNNSLSKIIPSVLFLTAGLAGIIIFFLMFFSVHPCTSSNWNLAWLHPLHIVAAILFFVKSASKCVYYYHFVNFVLLVLLLLAWCLIPQQLSIEFAPYILALLFTSLVQVLVYKKKERITEVFK